MGQQFASQQINEVKLIRSISKKVNFKFGHAR